MKLLDNIWFLESLKENTKERKSRGKVEKYTKRKKIKIRFKINKLFLYIT